MLSQGASVSVKQPFHHHNFIMKNLCEATELKYFIVSKSLRQIACEFFCNDFLNI